MKDKDPMSDFRSLLESTRVGILTTIGQEGYHENYKHFTIFLGFHSTNLRN